MTFFTKILSREVATTIPLHQGRNEVSKYEKGQCTSNVREKENELSQRRLRFIRYHLVISRLKASDAGGNLQIKHIKIGNLH